MNDLRVESRFKNARLYAALIDSCGALAEKQKITGLPLIKTSALFCGVPRAILSDLLNLRISPYTSKGKRKEYAAKIAEALGCEFEELFPVSLYRLRLPHVVVREYESEQILSLQEAGKAGLLAAPENLTEKLAAVELKEEIQRVLKTLTPREAKAVRMRFGLFGREEHDLAEIGVKLHITQERVRQIISKGLRKLRHPTRSVGIRQIVERGCDYY